MLWKCATYDWVYNMRPRIIIAVAACLILGACSRSKDTVIPSDPSKWSEMSEKLKDLTPEERQELAAYLMRNTLGGLFTHGTVGITPGTTVGQAIEQQKDFEVKEKQEEAQAEALKARAQAERNAMIEKLNHLVTFAVVSKQYVPSNIYQERFSDRVDFVFAVKNNTDKDIAGVKGAVEFRDMFGSTIENMQISLDRKVAANTEQSIDGYGKDINQFENSDQQLANTDLGKMKVKFVPEMIVFADGSSEKAPDESSE